VTAGCAFEERELEIPADLERLRDAREWANDIARDFGLDEEDCFQVKLATSEAVTNAIIHGSGAEGDAVRLAARANGDMLVFEVADRGREQPGSDPIERLAEGGRGLELVSMVMDEVQLVRRGGGGLLRFAKRRA
jgi:serine/threonine-protein kinase RsbW